MSKSNTFVSKAKKSRFSSDQRGNVVIIALVVLVVVAVGALAYLSGHLTKGDDAATAQQASAQPAAGAEQQTASGEGLVIEPGNPVVAKVDGEDVTRLDVFRFIQGLPPNTRQLPVDQLFPLALDQVINARVIDANTKNVNLDNNEQVKEQLAAAKENIVRNVYIQQQVDKKITEARLQEAYKAYKEGFPDIQEAKAAHILVDEEATAKELIKKIEEGADFAEVAKESSKDATAEAGGDLGYFAATDVVPPFAEAAFKLKPGEFTKTPVKSEFGYHIIKLEDKRKRPPAEFEQAKPFLEGQLRQLALNEVISEWRKDAKLERFDINGKEIEPAAGE